MLGHTSSIHKTNNIFTLQNANKPWLSMLALAEKQELPQGHVWHNSGEHTTFSLLHSGTVRLYCHTFSSKERLILEIGSGCLFREVGILYEGQRYSMRQVAMEPCVVYNFPATLLQDASFIAQHPELITNAIASMGAKLGAALSIIAETLKPSPEVMVAQYLLHYAKTPLHQRAQKGISQGELALSLGLHRSTVCKVLHDFREQGIIGKVSRKHMDIFNTKHLQEIIDS